MSTPNPTKQHRNIVALNSLLFTERRDKIAEKQNNEKNGYYYEIQKPMDFLTELDLEKIKNTIFGQQPSPKEQQNTSENPNDERKNSIVTITTTTEPSPNTTSSNTSSPLAIKNNKASHQEKNPTAKQQPFGKENDITKQKGDCQSDKTDTAQTISLQDKSQNFATTTLPLAQPNPLSMYPSNNEETKTENNIMLPKPEPTRQNSPNPKGKKTAQHRKHPTETFSSTTNNPHNRTLTDNFTIGLIALGLIGIVVIPFLLYYHFASQGKSNPIILLEDEEETLLTSPKTPKLGKPKTPPTFKKTLPQSTPYTLLLFFLLLAAITAALLRKKVPKVAF